MPFPRARLTLRPGRRGAKEPLDEALPALILLAPFRRPSGVGGRGVVEQESGLLGLRPVVQPDCRADHPSPSGRGRLAGGRLVLERTESEAASPPAAASTVGRSDARAP